MKAKGSKGAWDEWMGIQLECQYEEDLTKQPEARVRWYEAAGGTTLWEMTTDPVRSPRLEVSRRLHVVDGTRISHTTPGVVSLSSLSCFGPRRGRRGVSERQLS